MKKIPFLISCFLFTNFFIFAQTNIPGGQVSGTWSKANSPYLIQGAIMIANDSTLTIEPGVSVIFQGGYKFLVLGRLLAVGTLSDTITFTASDTSTGWRGIRFDNTPATNDTSKFFYCKLTYGKASGSGNDENGGGLFFNVFSKVIISNTRISNNSAYTGGGGYCYNSSPTITNNGISNNFSYKGGGIYCYGSNPTISNNKISNNSVAYGGGGIYCANTSSPTITNNIISNNSASGSGGGIDCYNYSSPIISNNTISNNSATYYSGGIYCDNSSSPTIFNNTISNNSASQGGGGICCISSSSPTISNNRIFNNSAGFGGGIYCNVNSNPTISNNTISINSGSGLYCSNASNPTISNNTIFNNSTSVEGGGIYCNGSNPIIYNNTISYNGAQKGGALFCKASNPNLRNTLIWGNTATTSGNQVYLEDESSDPNFYFCDVQGGKAGFGLNTNVFYLGTYSNNINSDPLFVDTTTADWSLQSTSPCINAGDSSGTYPSTDKAGNPRICDGRIDIGAYEFQKSPCITVNVSMDKSETVISLFPNPTNSVLYINFSTTKNEKIEITLINILGEEKIKLNYNNFQSERFINEIDMNGLSDQIYLVRVKINEQVHFKKICKIK